MKSLFQIFDAKYQDKNAHHHILKTYRHVDKIVVNITNKLNIMRERSFRLPPNKKLKELTHRKLAEVLNRMTKIYYD